MKKSCAICGQAMSPGPFETEKSWCWKCEPYRAGGTIEAAAQNKLGRIAERATIEFLKSLMFIAIGYGWAAAAYGVFPR